MQYINGKNKKLVTANKRDLTTCMVTNHFYYPTNTLNYIKLRD